MFNSIRNLIIYISFCLCIIETSADNSYPVYPYLKFTYQGEEVEISTDYANGALYSVEEPETNVFDIWPYAEDEYRSGWVWLKSFTRPGEWDATGFCFNFRMTGCKDKKIKINIHIKETRDKNTVSYMCSNPDFPVFSYDGETWNRMEQKTLSDHPTKEYWRIISFEYTYTKDTVYIAFQYPYSSARLDMLIEKIKASPYCSIGKAGISTEGKDIKMISITDPDIDIKDKKVVWFTGLQHSSELAAGRGLEAMINFLLSNDTYARKAREYYLFKIIPLVNIDAVDEGRGRAHSTGRNLNREWINTYPKLEVASIKQTFSDWFYNGNRFDIFIDFHGFSGINGDWQITSPDYNYISSQEKEYKLLLGSIQKYFPYSYYGKNSIVGTACDAVYEECGALSFTIDGWIYDRPRPSKVANLYSYYDQGHQIFALEDCQICAENYIKAFVDYAHMSWKTDIKTEEPEPIRLMQNYPNPFNSDTTICYILPETCQVSVDIFNVTGQLVTTLIDDMSQPGYFRVIWDGRNTNGKKVE
ncbi:MAG: hypothetical protein JXB48_15620, partial [Candidatus Latescibacteria bacterium]|nr:hypothetical protein [Candidatus Latescibacterota bacterium]